MLEFLMPLETILTLAVNDSRLHYCREKVCSYHEHEFTHDFRYILKFLEQSKLV